MVLWLEGVVLVLKKCFAAASLSYRAWWDSRLDGDVTTVVSCLTVNGSVCGLLNVTPGGLAG